MAGSEGSLAAAHLRGLTSSNGKVGVIGYCSGGRQSFLAACTCTRAPATRSSR
jgi:dienelactone hydrolase